ncbi:MATE family efflux transporter [Flavisphingomonas formosensis]|uniref:MATE family efflux transporter n=1 Tax=Flavisphingomonas formosensis TaxID=861534 RepID=UPI0012F94914|nr:MATE family efflux transporter [Sphingomonas formosensis]
MRLDTQEIAAEAQRILRLAWPVVLTSFNWTLMQLIDVAVVGHVGTAELGALAAGRTITFVTIVMGLAAMSGVLVFASRADGAGDRGTTGDTFRAGLVYGLGLGIIATAILGLWAAALLHFAGVPESLADEGAAVVRAMAYGFPGQLLLSATSYFLEGISHPRRVMAINMLMLPVNAVLAWAWAAGHLGLPGLGAVGAAQATACVSTFGGLAMLASVWLLPDARERGIRDVSAAAWGRALSDVPALLRFGFVPSVSAGLELAGFSWLIALSTQLGAVPAAAFQTVFSLHNFAFAMAIGFSSAAGVRAGNAVGEGVPDQAFVRTLIACALTTLVMGMLGLVYWFAGAIVVTPFSSDPAVQALAASLLLIFAPFMFFDGVQMVCVYALRSLGDQVVAGFNGIIAFFLVTGGLGWWLVYSGWGAEALAIASVSGMVVATLLQGGRMIQLSLRASSRS